jgi:hypothetical protein
MRATLLVLPLGAAAAAGIWAYSITGRDRTGGTPADHGSSGARAKITVPTATAPTTACGWVTAEEVQQLVGPLAAAPIPAGQECRYPLKVSDSLRAAMVEMRESDLKVFGKVREGSNPDSVALIVSVDLNGNMLAERATGLAGDMMAQELDSAASGEPPSDTSKTEPEARPAGWDVAGGAIWPGFSGRVGHVGVMVYTDVMMDLVPTEKMETLATRIRDRMPDRPYATDHQPGDAEMLTGIADRDPCSLLTRTEAEAVLGKLLVVPYRSAEESPLAFGRGVSCAYYTAGHHALVVSAGWTDGRTTFGMLRGVGSLVGTVMSDREAEAADTLEGPWDASAIGLDGQLAVLKGDRLLQIGYLASSTGAAGAVRLARVAVERLAAAH